MCSLWSAEPPYSGHLSPMRNSSVLQPVLIASTAATWASETVRRRAEADRGSRGRVLVRCRGFFVSGAARAGRVNSIQRNSKYYLPSKFRYSVYNILM